MRPPDREPMMREHGAWLDFCRELLKRGIDVNQTEQEPVAAAARKWGEELHALRSSLDPDVVARARREAREAYPGQYERGTYPEKIR